MLAADPGRSTVTNTSVALLLDYILTQQTIQNFVVALVCQSILPFKWKERRPCHLTISLAPGIVFGTSQNWMARHIMTTSPTPTHTAVFCHFQNGESLATIRNIDHVSLIGLVGPHMVSKLPVWQPVRFVTIHCWESNPEQQCSCSSDHNERTRLYLLPQKIVKLKQDDKHSSILNLGVQGELEIRQLQFAVMSTNSFVFCDDGCRIELLSLWVGRRKQ
jgi:hypothetical protein